jgi:hypothetical protein
MIPGSANPLLLATAAGAGGYEIERSLRFNSSDSAYLSRTPASAGNRKTWTWAGWVKGVVTSENPHLFTCTTGATDATYFRLWFVSDSIRVSNYNNNLRQTSAVYRDPSAWYHVVLAVDTTQATAANRIKLYVNGSEVTAFSSSVNPNQNDDLGINQAAAHSIGATSAGTATLSGYLADIHFIDGQALDPSSFGEFDTNGVWQPIAYAGTYGTNGFHLPFSDNSTAAALGTDTSSNGNTWTVNNIAVGGAQPALYSSPNLYTNAADVIANGTPLSSGSTFSSVYVYLVTNGGGDVGSKVFTADGSGNIGTNWTWLHRIGGSWTSSGGYNNSEWDLFTWGSEAVATNYIMNNSAPLHMLVSSAGSPQQVTGTIATFNSAPNSGAGNDSLVDSPTNYGEDTGAGGEVRGNYATFNPLSRTIIGTVIYSNGNLQATDSSGYGCSVGTIAVASGKYYWEIVLAAGTDDSAVGVMKATNSASVTPYGAPNVGYRATEGNKYVYGSASSYGDAWGVNDVIGVALNMDVATVTFYKNGISQGAISIDASVPYYPYCGDDSSATNSTWIANFGQRPFAYTAPSGFKALCTTNLPEPTIADGSTAMDVDLYTGTSASHTRTLGFSPDLVWIKQRGGGTAHCWYDIQRGSTLALRSNATTAEADLGSSNSVTFNSNGYTLGADSAGFTNYTGVTYVAWTWDAGSSTVTNTQGSITSQVRANASAGFSVVTYTGNGTNPGATIGHGLGVTPGLIITKARSASSTWWPSYHSALPISNTLYLNSTVSSTTYINRFSAVSSTTFTTGSNGSEFNDSGVTYVAYCFAPVAGYSSFGSYTGNGSADGPFVYTGFRPRWIILKNASAVWNWQLRDTARDTYNPAQARLYPNTSDTESTNDPVDILSNGFKIRATGGDYNGSGNTFVWAAFAEHPFATSRAR